MKLFWISLAICIISINTLAAILYTGVTPLDSGGGFISLSPMIDCVILGTIIAISGIAAFICWRKFRPSMPTIPRVLHYPIAYLVTLAILSLVVLVMGTLQLFDKWSGFIHLPFYGYVLFLLITYPLLGYIIGNKFNSKWIDLIWGILITAVLCIIGAELIRQVNAQDIQYNGMVVGIYDSGYTSRLMRRTLGGILGRINLPACVLMDTYEYAYFSNLGGVHSIPRDVMTYLVCACPPILFSIGWITSIIKKRK